MRRTGPARAEGSIPADGTQTYDEQETCEMKTKDLKPGMMVERKQGRDYPTFITDVMVLDNRMWRTVPSYIRREPHRFSCELASGPRSYGTSDGIPCAVKRWFPNRGYFWLPQLIRPSQLVPAGSKAEYEKDQAKLRAVRETTEQERANRLEQLKERSGVNRLRYATGWRNIDYHSVTLSIEDFEKLLERLP